MGTKKKKRIVSVKTKMNLDSIRVVCLFFFPIDIGVGNTVVEYLDGAVKI